MASRIRDRVLAGVILLASTALHAATADDLRVYQTPGDRQQTRAMLGQHIDEKMQAVWQDRDRELQALGSPEAWRARQQRTRDRLAEILGDFGAKCPLDARIVGKLDRPDCVIEKLVFQSQPQYYCTANVYVPKRRPFPQPGVLFTCGHAAEGKAARLYHEACLGLVLKGYVVLALDPTGQGERSEYFEPETGRPVVPLCVSQHHYLARPSWLVGRSLAGYRTWDATRAVDYLVTRPEVDAERIGVVGNSGGGIMALLATAVDPRIKVCAAAHPGGSMEETYLTGRELPKADLLSLIAPRPCLFIVGDRSGEESGHRRKMDWMRPFYRGLGAADDRLQMVLVDGVHDMKQPKREPAYGWLNRWLGKQAEGSQEPPLTIETPEQLRCTATGYTLRDLKGASGQTLNAACAESLRGARPLPESRQAIEEVCRALREAVRTRIGLRLPDRRAVPQCTALGVVAGEGFTAEKLVLESEPGIRLPALLLKPKQAQDRGPVVVHLSDEGKPVGSAQASLALDLVRAGQVVFSLDVRGAGETDPRDRPKLSPLTRYDPQQFRFDSYAVGAAQLGTTLLAMQTFDVVRGLDWIASRRELAGRPVFLVGEGLGGVWALTSAANDSRPAGVACVRTVPSYRLIVDSRYYACRDYFWVPRALATFDLPDLAALIAPRPLAWIDPVDAMLERLKPDRCQALCDWPRGVYLRLGSPQQLRVVRTADEPGAGTVGQVLKLLGTPSP
jgi:cephalosporin-C deacetylase-like acetyl esterase